jgi:hypothetical protein
MGDHLANSFSRLMGEVSTTFESEDRLVIALDFGTTFSGIAYTFANPQQKSQVIPIMDWPGKIYI